MSPVTKKYSQRSNPMRVIVCVACALIENASYLILYYFLIFMPINLIITLNTVPIYLFQGCSSVAINMKADLVASPVGLHSSVSSAENSAHV